MSVLIPILHFYFERERERERERELIQNPSTGEYLVYIWSLPEDQRYPCKYTKDTPWQGVSNTLTVGRGYPLALQCTECKVYEDQR
jgi:hypothetical protein